MATFRKRNGNWQALICCNGIRKAKTFNTKLEATHWASATEQEILSGKRGNIPDKTFGDLLQRYSETVSAHKRGARWEMTRINAICRDEIASCRLTDLTAKDFASWRDMRLKKVSSGSVLREMNILSHAINTSIKDWGWLKENPMSGIRRPEKPQPRDRLITGDEITRLLLVLGYEYDLKPITISARIGAALLFAIETAMRAGEICSLTWDKIDMDKCTALLIETKNGSKRQVPLSGEAIRILNQVKGDTDSVFDLTSVQIDVNFRKAKSRAMIYGVTFHDTRHLAITRLAKKIDVLSLARAVGHKDLKNLMIYYNESAEDIAKRLG